METEKIETGSDNDGVVIVYSMPLNESIDQQIWLMEGAAWSVWLYDCSEIVAAWKGPEA